MAELMSVNRKYVAKNTLCLLIIVNGNANYGIALQQTYYTYFLSVKTEFVMRFKSLY